MEVIMAKYYLGEQQYSDSTIKPIEGIEGKIISLVDKTSEFKTIDDLKKHLLEENKIKNLNVNLYYLTKNIRFSQIFVLSLHCF